MKLQSYQRTSTKRSLLSRLWPEAQPQERTRVLYRMRYLPLLMFLAFLISNTRLPPFNHLMLTGRWPALFGISGLTILLVLSSRRPFKKWSTLSLAMTLTFFGLIIALPYSANPLISFAKWMVFLTFMLFCGFYTSRINTHEDALVGLRPIMLFFIIFIWITPFCVPFFYQPLLGSIGTINGFLQYTNALGQFLAIFGIPTVIYGLETSKDKRIQIFFFATLGVAVFLIARSGSRTAAAILILTAGLALLRWRSRSATPLKIIAALVVLLAIPFYQQQLRTFAYKYPHAANLLESRESYWQDTQNAFLAKRWTGAGFGVQAQLADHELSVAVRGGFREQGSTYLGLLEEIGLLGAIPIFLLLLMIGTKNMLLMLRSRDPVRLLLARAVVAGLIWGASENYLFYLGNAASTLVFFPFYMNERLYQLASYRRNLALRQQALALQWRKTSATAVNPTTGGILPGGTAPTLQPSTFAGTPPGHL